jgi:hypothetical protein
MAILMVPERSNLVGAYFLGEFGFPHDGLDKLSKAMPSVRARFPTYAKYAAHTH